MKTGAMLPLVAAIACGACSHPETPPVPKPPDQPTAPSELGCELEVRRAGANLGLAFVLANHTPRQRTIRYFRPFLQFDVRVIADGRELTVVRGDFDGPAAPADLEVPAGGTAKLETPVTLQFAAKADPPGDAMIWTVIGEPRAVELRATLRIEHASFPECVAHVDRR